MCSGDGLSGKPKSKKPKDIRGGTRTKALRSGRNREAEEKAPEEMAMADGPRG